MNGKTLPSFEEAYAVTCSHAPDARSFSKEECHAYWKLLARIGVRGTAVEIGLQFGRSSCLVAQAAGPNGFLHIGIDPFIDPPGAAERWFQLMRSFGHDFSLHVMRSDSPALPDILHKAWVDVALIDGGHWSADVANDVQLIAPKIAPGGYLLFHDCGHELPNVYPCVPPELVRQNLNSWAWIEVGVTETLGIWQRTYD